ncbi:ShlB/FhaC/HecB family hemolysin secretion/activation protein [Halopseudomonas oceani]|uniref:ShlB/FhaC/HecB family hemolysin secretion/activation protein n=1 Tax=Halopseudomonas oceani TaxID=1708783 RepID=UPI002AA67E8E|nr:ShlB/FhaC/HecB family hemolysin secretion/activation protein [Halopseudomonas oceani]
MNKLAAVSSLQALGLISCLVAAPLQAAETAGGALRDLETRPLGLPPEPPTDTPTLTPPPATEQSTGGQAVDILGFRFTGNTAFSDEQLAAVLLDLSGQGLTLGQLQQAADRITAWYRQHDWLLARAILPPQEIDDGYLTIQIVEGKYDQVRLNNQSELPDRLLQNATRGLKAGDGVRAGALENALMSLDALPASQVNSRLSRGEQVGTSALDIDVNDLPALSGQLSLDNYGNTYNGEYRLTGGLTVANPFGLGDSLQLQALVSDGDQKYLSTQYELPVGPWNTRVGLSLSWLEYELGKDFDSLNAKGKAATGSVFASQNWWQQRRWGVSSRIEWRYRDLEDEQLGVASEKTLRSVTLDLVNGYWRDDLLGGSANSYRLSWTHGELSMDSPYAVASDFYGTEGRYHKVNLAVLRQQRLSPRFTLNMNFRGQLADGNLDSVEKMSLGGAYGIRAFPQGEASGDEGWLASTELRYALSSQWQLGAFLEAGEITYNKDPLAIGDRHRNLKGAGVSAYWQPHHQWQISATAATSLDGEEAASDEPEDVYLWGQVQWMF